MEKWYSRYRRGDVWFLSLRSEYGDGNDNSSVQKKSRPYLIVSCEENNLNAPTFNVVPICTRNNDHLPMHVFFIYNENSADSKNQIILCEQITTVSVLDFDRKGSYFMYSLNLNLMNQVDEALTRQLGLKPRVADMKVIERLIEEVSAKKEKEIEAKKEKEVQARVEAIVDTIAKRFGIDLNAEVSQNNTEYRDNELTFADKDTVAEMRKTASERKTNKTVPVEKPKTSKYVRKTTRNTWTLDKKKQFVEDYKTMSLSDMSDKWKMKKSSIQQSAYKFKKDIQYDS